MENNWLSYAKQLHALASTGFHFSKDEFDRERYQQIAAIANTMLADLADVPLARIEGLVSEFGKGYATPKVDVRGALIRENKILLVKEKSDHLWTLPGGFADVGLSAGENITKEFREEAGIQVAPGILYSIKHKAKHNYTPDARDFYKIFFLCEQLGDEHPSSGNETVDVDYFTLDNLPALSRSRVIESDLEMAFVFHRAASTAVFFD